MTKKRYGKYMLSDQTHNEYRTGKNISEFTSNLLAIHSSQLSSFSFELIN